MKRRRRIWPTNSSRPISLGDCAAMVLAYLGGRALDLVGKFGAHRLSIVEPGLDLQGLSDHVLTLPMRVDPLLAALAYLVPCQLIAYHWAVARGLNPDAPASMDATLAAVLPPGRQEPELRR